MEIEKLIEELRTKSLYSDKANLEIMDLCMEAAAQLERLNDFFQFPEPAIWSMDEDF